MSNPNNRTHTHTHYGRSQHFYFSPVKLSGNTKFNNHALSAKSLASDILKDMFAKTSAQ